jgi:hypothetical protein
MNATHVRRQAGGWRLEAGVELRAAALIAWSAVLLLGVAAAAAEPPVVLDETCSLRCYYRFATDLVSPALMKAEGEAILGKTGFDRIQRETQRSMGLAERDGFGVFRPSAVMLREARKVGTIEALKKTRPDPQADWRDLVFVRMFFDPYTAPPLPADWASATFDDSSWVVGRPFQTDMPNDLPPDRTTGNMSKVHIDALQFIGTGIHAACYRARFVVSDPSAALRAGPAAAGDMTLRLVYRGGVRAMVNGKEVGRGHLPTGALAPDTPGTDYPAEAYQEGAERDRRLGPLQVPAALLVKGTNVLAIEVRASNLNPIVLKRQQSRSWNALHDREGNWRHGFLARFELRAGASAVSGLRRPAGLQVWVPDIHHRVISTEFLPPGEPPGAVRVVGTRSGAYAAQVAVGTDKDLVGIEVAVGELKQVDGPGQLPGAAVKVFGMVPLPADEFNYELGDERGLDAKFPSQATLAQFQKMQNPAQPYVFDQISPRMPTTVPGGTCRPFWISLRIPPDAAPGKYRGAVSVKAAGAGPISLPMEVEVFGWRLPEPGQFQTFVGCEENPYGVAKQYGVPLWSDEHFKLLETSLRHLGRIGSDWLNVPILRCTEFGNKEDSMVRWVRKADGSLAFDYTVLDRYLDLAVREMGPPRVINFAVMHGNTGAGIAATPAEVNVWGERTARAVPLNVNLLGGNKAEAEKAWTAFALSLRDHMKKKGLDRAMHFGYPHDREDDPDLRVLLARVTPEVRWTAGPHQAGWQGFATSQYDVVGTVRYFGSNQHAAFRPDMGWKALVAHLTIPRIDSSVQSLHTASHPFAFRTLVNHSLALGRAGFCRVGADEWAAIHYEGMRVPTWIVGMPVLFTLWPGQDGAESSARFEVLLEGIQEGEARIFLEQALDRRLVTGELLERAQRTLFDHYQATCFFQNKLCIFELEKYHHGWQERSRALYQVAAEVAGRVRPTGPARPLEPNLPPRPGVSR